VLGESGCRFTGSAYDELDTVLVEVEERVAVLSNWAEMSAVDPCTAGPVHRDEAPTRIAWSHPSVEGRHKGLVLVAMEDEIDLRHC